MNRLSPRSAPPILLAVAMAAGLAAAWAQDAPVQPTSPVPAAPPSSEVVLELSGGQAALLKLAFPTMRRGGDLVGAGKAAADEVEETLRADLLETRVFELQGPEAFGVLTLTGDQSQDFEQYRSLGNSLLLQCSLSREGDRLVLEGTLFNLADGKSILGKRYRGGFELSRAMAHAFADEILAYLTGRRGIARTTIAFASDRDQQGRKEIYLMDYDGHNQRRLTAHRSTSLSPAWSADGSGVAYTSFFSGVPAIYFAEAGSGRKSPIYTEGRLNISPGLSPDGTKVAFAHSVNGNTEIYVSGRAGENPRQLTNSSFIDTNPAWSPKGNEIAFTSNRSGSPQIYAMDPEGTNVRRLTYDGTYNDNVAWSPDGTKIAHSCRKDGRFQIAVTDVVTLETRILTRGEGSHEDPSFSPDGRRIAFVWQRGGRKQIWVIDADSGANARVLTSVGNNESPGWGPYPP